MIFFLWNTYINYLPIITQVALLPDLWEWVKQQGALFAFAAFALYWRDKEAMRREKEKIASHEKELAALIESYRIEKAQLLTHYTTRLDEQDKQKAEVVAIYNAQMREQLDEIKRLESKVSQYEELQTKELKAALGLMAGTAVSVKNVNNAMDSGVLTKSVRVDELKAFMTEFLNRMSNGGER